MKNENVFWIFNFPITIDNWKFKKFYHFSIFNFEVKNEMCKNVLFYFNFKTENWMALSVHGFNLVGQKGHSIFVLKWNNFVLKWKKFKIQFHFKTKIECPFQPTDWLSTVMLRINAGGVN